MNEWKCTVHRYLLPLELARVGVIANDVGVALWTLVQTLIQNRSTGGLARCGDRFSGHRFQTVTRPHSLPSDYGAALAIPDLGFENVEPAHSGGVTVHT